MDGLRLIYCIALQVKDADGDEDVYLKYSIIEGNGGNKFKISMG